MNDFRELQAKIEQIEESYHSRLAAAVDELVVANPKLSPVQLVRLAHNQLGDQAAKYLSDKLEAEGDLADYHASDPQPHMRELGEEDDSKLLNYYATKHPGPYDDELDIDTTGLEWDDEVGYDLQNHPDYDRARLAYFKKKFPAPYRQELNKFDSDLFVKDELHADASIEEEYNINDEAPISAQVHSLLKQGKKVISKVAGATGEVVETSGQFIYIKSPNSKNPGVTSFDSDPEVEIEGNIDNYSIVKHWKEHDMIGEARGQVVEVPVDLQGTRGSHNTATSADAETFVASLGPDDKISHDVVDPETGELLLQADETTKRERYKAFTKGAKLREPESPIMHGGWDSEDYEAKMDSASSLINELRDSEFYNVVWKEMAELVDDPEDMADKDYDIYMDVPIAIKRKDGQKFTDEDHDNFKEIIRAVKNMSTMGNTGIMYAGTTNNGTVARFTPTFS